MSRETDAEILTRIDPVRRNRAFQLDMLAVDEEFNERWLQTMRELISKELGEPDFTVQRMAALKLWTRDRKRAQARLHWKYDGSGKRKAKLVERDINRAWDTLEQRVERLKKQHEERAASLAAEHEPQRQRTRRIREGMQAVQKARAEEAAQVRDRALDMVRQRLNLAPGATVTGEHITIFLNMARDLMTADDRALFLRTIQSGDE